eukprot:5345184-Pyramimonas_sp.AAC.1
MARLSPSRRTRQCFTERMRSARAPASTTARASRRQASGQRAAVHQRGEGLSRVALPAPAQAPPTRCDDCPLLGVR